MLSKQPTTNDHNGQHERPGLAPSEPTEGYRRLLKIQRRSILQQLAEVERQMIAYGDLDHQTKERRER